MEGEKRYFDGLDLLKALAATCIVFHHYQQVFQCRFPAFNFFGGKFIVGYVVELFFMISGFLALYMLSPEKTRFVRELLHKFLRIYPIPTLACLAALLIKSASAYLAADRAALEKLWRAKTLFANFLLVFRGWTRFTMTGVNNPTWYLCILIHCYVLFYAMAWLADRCRIKRIFLFAAIVAVELLLKRRDVICEEGVRGLESFFLGVFLCSMVQWRPPKKSLVAALGIAGTIVSVLLILNKSDWKQNYIVSFGIYPWLILAAYVFPWKSELARKLGKISFDVFVWHYPLIALERLILELLHFTPNRNHFTMLLFGAFVWAFSWLMYSFAEKPLTNWIRGKEGKLWSAKTLRS